MVSETKKKGRVANSGRKRKAWEGGSSIGLEGVADKGNFEQRAIAGKGNAVIQE